MMKYPLEEKSKGFLTVLVFVLLGWAVYAHVVAGEFVADDYPTIVSNLTVRNLGDLAALWRSFPTRFLVMLSFALNYHVHQLDVAGYHLVNIWIHVINALLVYVFVRLTFTTPGLRAHPLKRRARAIGFYAGLIFLVHPIQTQAVSYIMQRGTSLACLFYLTTLIFYIRARTERKFLYFPAAWATMLLGLLTKEQIVTLPATLLTYEIFFLSDVRKHWKTISRDIAPFVFLSGLLVFIFTQERSGSIFGLKSQLFGHGFSWPYFLTEINVLRTYLRLMILPVHQCHHYAYPLAQSFFEPGTLWSVFLLICLFASAVFLFFRRRLLSFAVIWFFITTSVEFIVVCFVNRGVLYEHWIYLAMVGFVIFLTVALATLIPSRGLFKGVMVLLVVVLSVSTYVRNFVWQTEIGFWEDVVKKTPDSPLVYLGSGTAYHRKGMIAHALAHYQKGLFLFFSRPRHLDGTDRIYLSRIYNNLGLVYQRVGRVTEAVRSYQRAYKINPRNASAYHNLAKICIDLKKYRQAIVFLKEELRINPGDPDVYYGLGLAFLRLNEKEKAKTFFEKTRQLETKYGNQPKADRLMELKQKL